jgi:hypothetical protein
MPLPEFSCGAGDGNRTAFRAREPYSAALVQTLTCGQLWS